MEKRLSSLMLTATALLSLCFIIGLSVNASAIVGKIGNARMVLNLETGDSIDRSILVINDNNVSVQISLEAAGELENNTKITDKEFILQPGEQKKAAFKLTAGNPGRYESKINVGFKPIGINESGVGIASQIVLNVYKKGELPENTNQANSSGNGFNFDWADNKIIILVLTTLVLIAIVLCLIYISKKKKRSENGGEFKQLKHHEAKV